MTEAKKAFEEYKTAHDRKQAEIFFEDHKHEHWFREKYDPEISFKWKSD
jgi:hypothetical protein